MNKDELYQAVLKRMENFHISFDEAIKEIKEIYPKYSNILDEMIDPTKTRVDMSCALWVQIETLMNFVSYSHKVSEERIQRQLGVVHYLYNKEFGYD